MKFLNHDRSQKVKNKIK